MTYLNLTKTQVANYLKQQGRIVAANKTGEKKNGKKGIFASTAQRIIRSGGGNSAALSCQGSTTSNGAENLTEACTCWSNSNFTALAATIRKCKISSSQKAVIAQLSSCKGNFSACKQAEDDGMKAMSSCATSKDA